jgi:hypothetical protein
MQEAFSEASNEYKSQSYCCWCSSAAVCSNQGEFESPCCIRGALDTVRADYNCLIKILPSTAKDSAPRRIEVAKKSLYTKSLCFKFAQRAPTSLPGNASRRTENARKSLNGLRARFDCCLSAQCVSPIDL